VVLIGVRKQRHEGVIDTISEDKTLLWIRQNGNERRLFLAQEIAGILVSAEDLQDPGRG
jgi:hypothetical protein